MIVLQLAENLVTGQKQCFDSVVLVGNKKGTQQQNAVPFISKVFFQKK